ncbi:MAG: hypothetical protein D6805_07980 [Planctomycetota bacterium]|nr:MAG: hypothetical protein D6805_07980 [Planctomycetota bacterium]
MRLESLEVRNLFRKKVPSKKSFWEGVVGENLFLKRVSPTTKKFLGSLKTFFLKRVSGKNVRGAWKFLFLHFFLV